ncbi:Quaternary ammonium compound-resistance protein SugE [Lacunisphaera limnophila]|uniref:Guanidinium exporter n=1 Tax=Lacunisphaera limnophila TaxID=1838286 RepID=A0A1D8AWI8_9BACT|nr:multidrug efflux SMR transporter [Lacunisphaera limnophila]AOS45257.1 Quaternary ammonium compound-resistance protein SugE [Lacunisphaera limnophila]
MNSWLILIVAGLLEVCWASSLKATAGFTRAWPTLFFITTLAGSMFLLSLAVKQLPVGTAYAVWVGIGAAGTALVAVLFLGETMTPARTFFLGLLIISIIGLKLTTAPTG